MHLRRKPLDGQCFPSAALLSWTQRGPAVVAHQSANANFGHGARTRFAAANAKYVPAVAGATRHSPVDQPRHIPETLALGADRLTRPGTNQLHRHLHRATHVLLRHDPRLTVHPGRLHRALVSLVALPFPDDQSHI